VSPLDPRAELRRWPNGTTDQVDPASGAAPGADRHPPLEPVGKPLLDL